jgi:2-phospho-L-lactate/phosphoenolpyruvate guanylyltransferase
MPDVTGSRARWAIVVPVKHLGVAKSRLAAAADVRRELALAMALDTVRAAVGCPSVSEVVAVSDDERAATALTAVGARVVPDRPDAGLNPALSYGARCAAEQDGSALVAAMSADLPALRSADLEALLDLAAGAATAFVADAAGDGTTLLCAASTAGLAPRFGPQSRQAHLAAGAVDLTAAAAASVRQDVDTLADLAVAVRLGLGAETARVLSRHPSLLAATGPDGAA